MHSLACGVASCGVGLYLLRMVIELSAFHPCAEGTTSDLPTSRKTRLTLPECLAVVYRGRLHHVSTLALLSSQYGRFPRCEYPHFSLGPSHVSSTMSADIQQAFLQQHRTFLLHTIKPCHLFFCSRFVFELRELLFHGVYIFFQLQSTPSCVRGPCVDTPSLPLT